MLRRWPRRRRPGRGERARSPIAILLALWALGTAIAGVLVHGWTAIAPDRPPSAAVQRWLREMLEAGSCGERLPAVIAAVRDTGVPGPNVVVAWRHGRVLAKHVGEGDLADTVVTAARAFRAVPGVCPRDADSEGATTGRAEGDTTFAVSVTAGDAAMPWRIPYLGALAIVPRHDGVSVRIDGSLQVLTPDELAAAGAYEHGIATPIPDLVIGVDVRRLIDRMARNAGVELTDVVERGEVRRLRMATYGVEAYPSAVALDPATLHEAVADGARFLLRHQQDDGRYTYIYDARTGRSQAASYNLPRHAGTTYFLAQVARLSGMPEAREGALRALRWVERATLRRCGGADRLCVASHGQVEMGSSALTALAASEFLLGGDDAQVRRMLEGLLAYIRSAQRADGELMHEFDLSTQQAVDVQHMYYSGEAAFALLRGHAVLGNPADLHAARKVMRHLTGAGWNFLGSRYYYGEEHWTCIAAAEAARHGADPEALDFCRRWAAWNARLQFHAGGTPWQTDGAYGVGPIVVPRLTPVGSRSEALISTFEMSEAAGLPTAELRTQIERGLGLLLRYRWAPGPRHLFADPAGALGGIPGSPIDLTARNDYVQHGASAMLRWAERLGSEERTAVDRVPARETAAP